MVLVWARPSDRDRFAERVFEDQRAVLSAEKVRGLLRGRVADEDRGPLNDLRRALDAGGLGDEGFQTAMRLGGGSVAELKRIVFRPPPAED